MSLNICHLISGDDSLKILGQMEARWSFQTFKRLLNDWFRPKYSCKVSSYIDNTRVLLCSRLVLRFSLNYSSYLL